MNGDSVEKRDAAESQEMIDVQRLLAESSIEELNRLAEEYFSRLTTWDYHLSKPFGAIDETPQLLINFAIVLQGLNICPGMTVLEFGAGTGWASRFLSQLGCKVIAVDVSPTALRISAELYKRQPLIGERSAPQFLLFDGERLEIPEESVDRIMCLDAFHHVPNTAQVLRELARVLKEGGIAGFAEPGPEHSKSPQSQYEMRTYKVIENDVDIRAIWREAAGAGFTEMKLAVFNIPPFHLSMDEFENFLSGEAAVGQRYLEAVTGYMQGQRNFFLYKGTSRTTDSRFRAGLKAAISIQPSLATTRAGEAIKLHATVKNISPSIWLPRGAGLGAVHLGCHVYTAAGEIFRHSYHWESLTPGEGRQIMPGETVSFDVNLPALPKGQYILEFDMVSNDVCWFALNGSQQVRVSAIVI